MSIQELAKRCRTSIKKLTQIETGELWPDARLLKAYCKALNKDPLELAARVAFQFRDLDPDIRRVLIKHFQLQRR